MRKLLVLPFLLVIAVFFAGCTAKNTATIYGADKEEIVFGEAHNGSLGYMMGKTDSKGNLTLLVIDELFMPSDWAKIIESEAVSQNMETIKVGDAFYAKFIYIAGELYTGESDGESISYYSNGIVFSAVYSDFIMAKNYYDAAVEFMQNKDSQMMAFGGGTDGKTKVSIALNEAETECGVRMGEGKVGAGLSFFKRESGYWSDRNGLGLAQNYDAIEEYLRTYGLNVDASLIPEENSGTWSVGDISTGATLTDFRNYILIAKQLYDKIK